MSQYSGSVVPSLVVALSDCIIYMYAKLTVKL